MADLMFYERAVALNRTRHLKLKIEALPNHYAFAAKTNAMPIALSEFAEAAREVPIVFVGETGGQFSAAALVGLRDSENLMVGADGTWAAGGYIPAFARRYPFVLAQGDDKERLTVCIDEAYGGLGEERGEALFDAEGKETPYLARVLDFLRVYHDDLQRTVRFGTRLAELGLLVPKVITVERDGGKRVLQGLWTVDPDKLRGIDDARAVELFRNDHLGWIHAHLISLGNVTRLAARLPAGDRVSEAGVEVTA